MILVFFFFFFFLDFMIFGFYLQLWMFRHCNGLFKNFITCSFIIFEIVTLIDIQSDNLIMHLNSYFLNLGCDSVSMI